MWPTADSTPLAPNNAPTSEPRPQACRHTAPSECNAGFPPDVNEERHDKVTKIDWDLLEKIDTRLFAMPSRASDAPARKRSKFISAEMSCASGFSPGKDRGSGFRNGMTTVTKII